MWWYGMDTSWNEHKEKADHSGSLYCGKPIPAVIGSNVDSLTSFYPLYLATSKYHMSAETFEISYWSKHLRREQR